MTDEQKASLKYVCSDIRRQTALKDKRPQILENQKPELSPLWNWFRAQKLESIFGVCFRLAHYGICHAIVPHDRRYLHPSVYRVAPI
jgi:hypothetical protein